MSLTVSSFSLLFAVGVTKVNKKTKTTKLHHSYRLGKQTSNQKYRGTPPSSPLNTPPSSGTYPPIPTIREKWGGRGKNRQQNLGGDMPTSMPSELREVGVGGYAGSKTRDFFPLQYSLLLDLLFPPISISPVPRFLHLRLPFPPLPIIYPKTCHPNWGAKLWVYSNGK
jgi:hypothetical protein